MNRLTRADLTRVIVTEGDVRDAINGPGQCGYCESRVGEEHEAECVCRKRPVLVELRIKVVVAKPESWGAEQVEFQFNEGSYCMGNLIGELSESDDRAEAFGCCDSCGRAEATFLRPATDEDIEQYALLRDDQAADQEAQ